jgi:hypothetical protein
VLDEEALAALDVVQEVLLGLGGQVTLLGGVLGGVDRKDDRVVVLQSRRRLQNQRIFADFDVELARPDEDLARGLGDLAPGMGPNIVAGNQQNLDLRASEALAPMQNERCGTAAVSFLLQIHISIPVRHADG